MMRTCAISGLLFAAGIVAFPAAVVQAEDFIVNPAAAGCLKEGGDETYFCTIQEAIDAAHADGGGDVVVMPGTYIENLILRPEVRVKGEGGLVVVESPFGSQPPAVVVAASESGLAKLTVRLAANSPVSPPLVLISGVEEVELEEVVLDGGLNRHSVGVYVQNQMLETSRIHKSTLRSLEVGVLAEDTRFRITRCLFEDLLRDGIFVRPPSSKGEHEIETPEVGDEDDLEFSGFNRFRNIGGFSDGAGNTINENDSFLLRNTTGRLLTAQLNDWGVYESEGIAGRLSASPPGGAKSEAKAAEVVQYEPFLGKSIFPGSVFLRLKDAVSLLSLSNANPRLLLRGADTGIAPGFDAVSRLYSFTFLNPDLYAALGQAAGYFSSSRPALVGPGDIVALEILLTPDGSGEGEPPTLHSSDQNGDGRINLSELLRVVQFFNLGAYHCEAGTEDGYAVGPGAQDCAPHASDYAPQDWSISLSETLRCVQFYNSNGYHACSGTEDGFCPGQPG